MVNVSGGRPQRGTFCRLMNRYWKREGVHRCFANGKIEGLVLHNTTKKIQFTPFQIQKVYWLLRNCTFWRITQIWRKLQKFWDKVGKNFQEFLKEWWGVDFISFLRIVILFRYHRNIFLQFQQQLGMIPFPPSFINYNRGWCTLHTFSLLKYGWRMKSRKMIPTFSEMPPVPFENILVKNYHNLQ